MSKKNISIDNALRIFFYPVSHKFIKDSEGNYSSFENIQVELSINKANQLMVKEENT